MAAVLNGFYVCPAAQYFNVWVLVMGLICLQIFLNFMLFVLARAYSVVDGSFIIVLRRFVIGFCLDLVY